MKGFFKTVSCPSSQELADLENGALEPHRMVAVQQHLEDCDFCDAEAELYARFPVWPDDQIETAATEMPRPLLELAESLLRGKESGTVRLDGLFTEHSGVH